MSTSCAKWPEIGTVATMATRAKRYEPLDVIVVQVLNELVDAAGFTRRPLAAASTLGVNRIGIILRGEAPPPTIGEIDLLARALDTRASTVLREAEARAKSPSARPALEPIVVTDADLDALAAEKKLSRRPRSRADRK